MQYFKETQEFRQPWLFIPLIVFLFLIILMIFRQVYIGEPVGNNPAPDWVLGLVVLLQLGLITLFWHTRLETEMDETGVRVRFFPFHRRPRFFAREDIQSINVRKYNPLLEYGGWGWRYSMYNGRAFNVSGNMGIQLVLKNGKRLLIGTQKAKEAEDAIQNLKL